MTYLPFKTDHNIRLFYHTTAQLRPLPSFSLTMPSSSYLSKFTFIKLFAAISRSLPHFQMKYPQQYDTESGLWCLFIFNVENVYTFAKIHYSAIVLACNRWLLAVCVYHFRHAEKFQWNWMGFVRSLVFFSSHFVALGLFSVSSFAGWTTNCELSLSSIVSFDKLDTKVAAGTTKFMRNWSNYLKMNRNGMNTLYNNDFGIGS